MPLKQPHSLVGSCTVSIDLKKRQEDIHICTDGGQMHTCTHLDEHILSCTDLLETFQQNNTVLDDIQKSLETYLESKRVIFPRYTPTYICYILIIHLVFYHPNLFAFHHVSFLGWCFFLSMM